MCQFLQCPHPQCSHFHPVQWPHGHLLQCPHSCPLQCPNAPGGSSAGHRDGGVRTGHGRDTPFFPWLQFPLEQSPGRHHEHPCLGPGPGRVRGPSPARASDTHVPPKSVPMPRKGGCAQESTGHGGPGQVLFKDKQLWGQLLQASPTALWSSSTSTRNSTLAKPAPLSAGLEVPGVGLTPNTPQEALALPPGSQGRTGQCQQDAPGWVSTRAGTEGMRTPVPQLVERVEVAGPYGRLGVGWQVSVGCSGLEWGLPTPGIPFSGSVAVPGPERRHQKRPLTARAGEPRCPQGGRPVSANKVCIIKAGSFGLVPPGPPRLGEALGWVGGGQDVFGGGGTGAGAGSSLTSPITRAHRASWAWPGRG